MTNNVILSIIKFELMPWRWQNLPKFVNSGFSSSVSVPVAVESFSFTFTLSSPILEFVYVKFRVTKLEIKLKIKNHFDHRTQRNAIASQIALTRFHLCNDSRLCLSRTIPLSLSITLSSHSFLLLPHTCSLESMAIATHSLELWLFRLNRLN